MVPWRGLGSVVVGAVATVALTGMTVVSLPILGLLTAETVGNWLPTWVFALPVATSIALGGAIAGYLHGDGARSAAALGSVAAALGFAVVGALVGLLLLVYMLGFVPAHAEVDFSGSARYMMALGGAVGLVLGAVLGACGGYGGHLGRQRRRG